MSSKARIRRIEQDNGALCLGISFADSRDRLPLAPSRRLAAPRVYLPYYSATSS